GGIYRRKKRNKTLIFSMTYIKNPDAPSRQKTSPKACVVRLGRVSDEPSGEASIRREGRLAVAKSVFRLRRASCGVRPDGRACRFDLRRRFGVAVNHNQMRGEATTQPLHELIAPKEPHPFAFSRTDHDRDLTASLPETAFKAAAHTDKPCRDA